MPQVNRYRGRRAAFIENRALRVTVLQEGGHIAEILDKRTGANPLWTPPWPSIEPSTYERAKHELYGGGVDAPLLAGIMGHNLCLDIFGGPSAEEAASGLPVHGEASRVRYNVQPSSSEIVMQAKLPLAGLQLERRIELDGAAVRIRERVQNAGGIDRPIAWTQHVTLGPPFLEKGATQFRSSATRSKVHESIFGADDYLEPAAEFVWPHAPLLGAGRGRHDLRVCTPAARSSAYTAHLMDPGLEHAYFVAFSPAARLAFGYVWRRAEFPWMGIWEENHSRTQPPWNARTLTRGMEFGVSPFPESRRAMVERGRLFDVPTFRWIPAASALSAEYWVLVIGADAIPDRLEWPA
ncbi:MAG TPA: hypothetical protein VD833_03305 [Vicinamibacterales bacterium]|nr:hypothetical protein [Vicinamibacterales bacterium]